MGWIGGIVCLLFFAFVQLVFSQLLASVFEVDGKQHPRYFEAVAHVLGRRAKIACAVIQGTNIVLASGAWGRCLRSCVCLGAWPRGMHAHVAATAWETVCADAVGRRGQRWRCMPRVVALAPAALAAHPPTPSPPAHPRWTSPIR